jgi:acyl dehydratase
MSSKTVGRITDEGIARLREYVGKQHNEGSRPWRTEVTRDAAYHLAFVVGDMNPLFVDEEYAKSSVWGGLLAPSLMVGTMDTLRTPESPVTVRGLAGVHSIWTRSGYKFERPLRVGDTLSSVSLLKEVTEVESGFAGGRAVYQTYEATYTDGNGNPFGSRQDTWIRAERQKTRDASKYQSVTMQQWTKSEIDAIYELYDQEARTPNRKFSDVVVGEELPVIVKGPLTATSEIAFEAFFGLYLVGNKIAADLHRKHPALMVTNEQGVPEPPQRVHWDAHFANDVLGLPGAYDVGIGRCFWLMQAVSSWMGDAAYVSSIDVQYRKFNYLGDVTFNHGRVTSAEVINGQGMVQCDIWCENQRGEVTAKGTAEIKYL